TKFVRKQIRNPARIVFGHAHSVYLIARYVQEQGITNLSFKSAITSAMVLHDYERRAIEQSLRCRVFNRYGCEEVSLIASECEAHAGLHENMDLLYVEVLTGDRPASPGEPGSVVVTDLT